MTQNAQLGLFIIRIFLGITFFAHGLDKFQGGIGNTAGFFESIGIPAFLAYVVALIELVGGIALIIGLGTRVASALVGIVMIGAILKVKIGTGFLGGYELDFVLLGMAIALALSGSSLYAVETKLLNSTNKTKAA